MVRVKLATHSPSPSTISYTVSNASPIDSYLSWSIHVLFLMLRVFVAVACLIVLVFQCKRALGTFKMFSTFRTWQSEKALDAFILDNTGVDFASSSWNAWVLFIASAMMFWIILRRDHIEESLLLVRGLGIQTSTSPSSYLSTPTKRFIPTSQIQDIFIHEAFIGFQVKFYLAVVVEGEDKTVVVFPKLLPRREILEDVWRGARATLGWSKNYLE